jgi:hypothetical protein
MNNGHPGMYDEVTQAVKESWSGEGPKQPGSSRDEPSFIAVSRASCANSAFGVVNLEKPQFRQTKSLGNTGIPGLSRLFRPVKWIITSAVNSTSLGAAQDRQDTKHLPEFDYDCAMAEEFCCLVKTFRILRIR